MKHTPGPWYAIPHPDYSGSNYRIARSPDEPWSNFDQIAFASPANARLIAKAPDLLEALRYWLPDESLVEPEHRNKWHETIKLLQEIDND